MDNIYDQIEGAGHELAHLSVTINYMSRLVMIIDDATGDVTRLTGQDFESFAAELERLEERAPECLTVHAMRYAARPYLEAA